MQKLQKSSSSSTEKVAVITDILWQILLRLPLKPLLRSKLVSKQWLALISDQRFRESHSLHHHHHHRRPTSLIIHACRYASSHILSFTTTTPTLGVLSLDFLNQSKVKVIRSCNGLLLCYSGSTFLVCNPITQDFTTLAPHRYLYPSGIYLAFDPDISPYCKVISVVQWNDKWFFFQYSFKTRSWISLGAPPFPNQSSQVKNHSDGVYCNRAIHWCEEAESSVYFDVDTLRLRNWPMPLSASEWKHRGISCFVEYGGRLYMVLCDATQLFKYDIFKLNEDYSGWSRLHRVDCNPLRRHMTFCIQGLAIVHQAKEENLMLVLVTTGETIILYDPVTSRQLCNFETGVIAGRPQHSLPQIQVFPYFENTALVEACIDTVYS